VVRGDEVNAIRLLAGRRLVRILAAAAACVVVWCGVLGWSPVGLIGSCIVVTGAWVSLRGWAAVVRQDGASRGLRVLRDGLLLTSRMREEGWEVLGIPWLGRRGAQLVMMVRSIDVPAASVRTQAAAGLAQVMRAHAVTFERAAVPGIWRVLVVYDDPFGRRGPQARSVMPEIMIDLGRREDGSRVVWVADQGMHLAVQGGTGSGKTTMLRSILQQAAAAGVTLSGSDVTGLLLPTGSESRMVIGARRLGAHVELLESLVEYMNSTTEQLAERAVTSWRQLPGVRLHLVVVEELPALVHALRADDLRAGRRPGDRLLARLELALQRLAAEGRKAGVVLVVACQRFDAELVGGFVRNNFAGRVSLRVDVAGVAMLHPAASREAAAALSAAPPGVGLVELPGLSVARFLAEPVDDSNYPATVTQAARRWGRR